MPNDDLPEIVRIYEPSGRANGVCELLAFGSGFSPDLAGGIHRALLLDGVRQIGNGQPKFRQLIWLDPDAHRVISRTKIRNLSNSRNAE